MNRHNYISYLQNYTPNTSWRLIFIKEPIIWKYKNLHLQNVNGIPVSRTTRFQIKLNTAVSRNVFNNVCMTH